MNTIKALSSEVLEVGKKVKKYSLFLPSSSSPPLSS